MSPPSENQGGQTLAGVISLMNGPMRSNNQPQEFSRQINNLTQQEDGRENDFSMFVLSCWTPLKTSVAPHHSGPEQH